MSRRTTARAALALSLVLGVGCQDYNFNPAGHCLIQPGTKRVTLSEVSTADVLFVVDDSGSMKGEQDKLALNFNRFIENLNATNDARASAGLVPIDFHIAVTSTSVFWNPQTTDLCSSSCPGAAGQLVCCVGSTAPARQPKACTSHAQCTVAGTKCRTTCNNLKGEGYCCADGTLAPADSFPAGSISEVIPCSREGTICGRFDRHYDFPGGCNTGVAADGWPYPRGDFVSWVSGAGAANPRVLHFDKQLYTGGIGATNRQGFTKDELVDFFAGGGSVQGNVITGTCGSGQEQGFQAARLAIEKAIAGQQKDTYGIAAGKIATWDNANRTATSQAEWLHPNSKLTLVFVGDEDDCSSPEDPSAGVVMNNNGPGDDACAHDQDASNPAPHGHKQYDVVTRFVDYFTGLGRPLGVAFIESAAQTSCSGDECTAGTCCQPDCPSAGVCSRDSQCGGQAAGTRFFRAASELRARGADVVVGSICDPNFGTILNDIAEIVKPPSGLTLPSQPAESAITVLRIADSNGVTRKLCGRPLPAASYTLQEATNTRADWWFTATRDPGPPVALSKYVYINPQGKCIANPGETYSADYLGRVPDGGCWNEVAGRTGDQMCQSLLGGQDGSWKCYGGVDTSGVCIAPTAAAPGTCLCNSTENGISSVCPNG
jgi:hypothetical protein